MAATGAKATAEANTSAAINLFNIELFLICCETGGRAASLSSKYSNRALNRG